MTQFTLPAIPVELEWKNLPIDWKIESDDCLSILAGAKTDWFIDPGGSSVQANAPTAIFRPPDENFMVSARVMVDFVSTYDAGVLHLYESESRWAKLCFEYSPQRQPMIVSVVTRDFSDDCNSVEIKGQAVYLRLTVTPQTIAFHYSLDAAYWNLVRYFSLGKMEHLRVGFSSQSPTGQQCRARFSEIQYRAGVLKDYRSGE